VALRQRIGKIHARIELYPEDFAAFYRFYLAEVFDHVPEIDGITVKEALALSSSLTRLALFDISMTLAQYHQDTDQSNQDALDQERAALAKTMSATADQLQDTVSDFAAGAVSLADASQETVLLAQRLLDKMTVVENINATIQDISGQTNLLGLNAAI